MSRDDMYYRRGIGPYKKSEKGSDNMGYANAKFNIGDKVRILDVDSILFGRYCWNNGDVAEVLGFTYSGNPRIKSTKDNADGDYLVVFKSEFHAIELVKDSPTTHNENLVLTRLFNAEAEIDELKRKVTSLEKVLADNSKLTSSKSKLSPNQLRSDVIKQAEAFVEDLRERIKWTHLSFHVNAEKGVVTVLAKGRYTGIVRGKAFARCAPGDVFNDKIGKAIAAGRLYGVDIPQEFLDAPQP